MRLLVTRAALGRALKPSCLLPLTPLTPLTPSPRPRPSSSFASPAPPKLPPAQQAEFERLQRQAAAPLSQPDAPAEAPPTLKEADAVNPAYCRGAPPEFSGDKNPRTGEVGGPKNEPLRWGGDGDWSYNGRVTDF
ncbi:uncharacterized protein UV8b_05365 [Ustilaginoidea virens]|uniref:Succinate dehydrogenase assembly factor 4, mitochondrial n=1 Tax=Ustilaginoidea virens TaxID=1159556 RepID=A0A063C5E6_USTVR|nr:uncharacterized protein UV8b_05365 [Ustilaginoidea virens]QUC21122.1 hypothetical protein UV8b_05365 [Ustilaginoidea virens]GAO14573.1 hypothetical protein UVI_02009700 [Ustilaginoidea virens]